MAGQWFFQIAYTNRTAFKHTSLQSTTSSSSRADRMDSAHTAADELHSRINPSTGIPSGMLESSILPSAASCLSGSLDGADTVSSDGPSNRTIGNMLIVLASQDLYSGNTSWKAQVVDNTLALYESGQQNLENRVSTLLHCMISIPPDT